MKQWLKVIKAEAMMRIAGFIAQQHESAGKRLLVRLAVKLNLVRHGHDPLGFLHNERSIDLLDYESEDEFKQ